MSEVAIKSALATTEGDGADVNRLFPLRRELMNFDPFVLFDHFQIAAGHGFPAHPHRGFEAITYLFQGSIEHKDNLNNQSVVYAGGAQSFTAGRGIIHSEMPHSEHVTEGIQVWINLPRHLKKIEPQYQQLNAQQINEERINDVRVRKIVDANQGVQLNTSVKYLDVQFEGDALYSYQVPFAHRGFVYVVSGNVAVNADAVNPHAAYFFEQSSKEIAITGDNGARIMIISGVPHRQPIYQHGPYVD